MRIRQHPETLLQTPSTTPPILPPCPPPLLPLTTIKHLLPQLPIHLVMRLAQPAAKLIPAPRLDLLFPQIGLEILGADPARVEFRKEMHKVLQIGLLLGSGRGRVGGGDGVEESPGAPAELLDVGRAVVGWLLLGLVMLLFKGGFGLRGPRGEGGAGSAAGRRCQ